MHDLRRPVKTERDLSLLNENTLLINAFELDPKIRGSVVKASALAKGDVVELMKKFVGTKERVAIEANGETLSLACESPSCSVTKHT